MRYLIFSILIIVNSLLYRMGGMAGWDKLWRRIGCAVVTTGAFLIFLPPHWSFILHALLLYAALTTYHDYLNKGKENWLCWLTTGLVYGAAAFPLMLTGVGWLTVVIRAVVLGLATMIWSEYEGNATREELGRGALLILTIPIL